MRNSYIQVEITLPYQLSLSDNTIIPFIQLSFMIRRRMYLWDRHSYRNKKRNLTHSNALIVSLKLFNLSVCSFTSS
jgi:hypothetical protein